MKKVLVFVLVFLVPVTSFAAPVTITRAKFEKIGKALKVCKAMKKTHKVRIQALKKTHKLELKREKIPCSRGARKGNSWLGVSLFLGGILVGSLLTGLAVWQYSKK